MMERFINSELMHITFGMGVITQFQPGMITIHFQELGDKKFKYPEAFERYLKALDSDIAAVVAHDLDCYRRELEEKKLKEQLRREECLRLQAEEKALLAAEKRKMSKGNSTKRSAKAKTV